jgi:sugar lactone lactonase YvrE
MASNGSTVWIGDQLNQLLRSMDTASASVGTLAGQIGNAIEQNGTGSSAGFNYPAGMTTDGKFLYVCDQYGMTIRKVDIATGAVTTIAGSDGSAGFVNGAGTAARFDRPVGLTTDGTSLFVVDLLNNAIRRIDLVTLQVSTLAGRGPGSPGDTDSNPGPAPFNNPNGITTDGTNLYVTESSNHKIRQIVIATGVVTTLAGPAQGGYPNDPAGYVNGTGSAARFRSPIGITTDGTNLYVADQNCEAIRQIVIATGVVTTLAGAPEPPGTGPFIEAAGEIDGTGTSARFSFPIGITTDGVSLIVADRTSNVIRRVR